jgi:hypothetical protein
MSWGGRLPRTHFRARGPAPGRRRYQRATYDVQQGAGAEDRQEPPAPRRLSHTLDAETERLLSLGAHQAVVGDRAVLRPIYTEPVIASVALTEQQARQQHGEDVATGLFPWIANARAVMQDEHAGWVTSIHETRVGRMLGLVMVGPHVTDMVEAGVIAIDAGATVETVADAMAPHPTLSETIRGAALIALGRAIDIPIPRIQIHRFRLARLWDLAQSEGRARRDVTATQALALINSLPKDPATGRTAKPYLDVELEGLRVLTDDQ